MASSPARPLAAEPIFTVVPHPNQPIGESERLKALWDYDILGTPPEAVLDDLVRLAANFCETPISLISLVEEDRQWFKAKVGLDVEGTPRSVSFCTHVVQQRDLLVVPDAAADQRFFDNPLVTGEPGIRFYAGAPLITPQGHVLGALCVIDRHPRTLSSSQEEALRVLSRQVMTQLELRRHTQALAESEKRSRAIVESALDAIVTIDCEGLISEFNPAAEKMFGWKRAQVLGQDMAEVIIPPAFREAHRRGMKRYLQGGQAVVLDRRLELTAIRADGSEFPVELTATRLGNCTPPRFTAFLRDLSELKRAELAATKLAAIVESSHDSIIAIDLGGLITSWNQGASRIYGYGAEEMIGASVLNIVPPDHRDEAVQLIGRIHSGERIEPFETLQQRKDGTLFEVSVTLSPIRSHAGQIIGVSKVSRDITERHRAMDAVRESEERFRLLAQATNDAMWEWDMSRQTLWRNQGYSNLFGHALDDREYTLESWSSRIHPEDYDRVMRSVHETVTLGKDTWTEEYRYQRADGSYAYVFDRGYVIRDKADVPIRMVGGMSDFTHRREQELALRQSNRALQMLSRCNEALMRSETEDALLAAVCQIAVEIGGFSLASVCYASPEDSEKLEPRTHVSAERDLPVDTSASWFSALLQPGSPAELALTTGVPVVFPDLQNESSLPEHLRSQFQGGPAGVASMPLKLQGVPFGVLLLYLPEVRPVSPEEHALWHEFADDLAFGIGNLRVREQGQLDQLKLAQQAALLDKTRDAIFVQELDDRLSYWNQGAERLLGWTEKEALGKSAAELIYPDFISFDEAVQTTLQTGEWIGEITQITREGKRLIVEGRWTLLRNEAGTPISILAVSTDITERKQIEQQFLRAQRMDGIGTLAGGIAHDLNNVLGPILMSLDLMRLRFADPESLDLISLIHSSAQRGADLVTQVLSFARGVEGQRVPVTIKHLVKDIEKISNDTFLKHISIRSSLPPDLWQVSGDPTQLHQVLLNLCVNARDAMPNGGTLTLTASNVTVDEQYASMNREAKPGTYVLVQVEDSGTGISPEIIEKIFDPFFTTKEIGKGTGLGLSTTMAIVKSHGGFIQVQSEPGTGTTFKVYLPARAVEQAARETTEETEMPRGQGELILLVDDEASIRQITKQTLEAFGYRVLLASDGAEALATYTTRSKEISVVLTDVMMPVMDGLAIIQVIRRLNPTLPIIAATGLANSAKAAQAANYGIRHFLSKPYTAQTLLKILRELLRP